MKRTKLVFAIAAAALLSMAAFSAVGASAADTVMCERSRAEVEPCPAGEIKPAGSGFGILSKEFKLKDPTSSYVQLGCGSAESFDSVGSALFGSTAQSGSPLPAQSEMFLMSEKCKSFAENPSTCQNMTTLSVSLNSPSATITAFGAKTQATIYVGSATNPLIVHIVCQTKFFPVECNYTAEKAVGIVMSLIGTREAFSVGTQFKLTGNAWASSLCRNGMELNYKGNLTPPWTGLPNII